MTHQSRPGKKDFTSTSSHAREFQRLLGRTVKFIDDICGEKAFSAIEEMKVGDILMLDNVRMNEEELEFKLTIMNPSLILNLSKGYLVLMFSSMMLLLVLIEIHPLLLDLLLHYLV